MPQLVQPTEGINRRTCRKCGAEFTYELSETYILGPVMLGPPSDYQMTESEVRRNTVIGCPRCYTMIHVYQEPNQLY